MPKGGKKGTYKFRELVKRLREHDERFEILVRRGKGSERLLYHPDVGGRPASFPITCHGEGTEIRKGMIAAIRRRFSLPPNVL